MLGTVAFAEHLAKTGESVALVTATCVGASSGALSGLALGACAGALARLGRSLRMLFWFGLGALSAAVIGSDLGIAARIGGTYTVLALAAATVLAFGAAVLGLAGLALTPGRDGSSWLARQPRALRLSLSVIAVSGAVILDVGERDLLEGGYPLARAALRAGVLGALLFAGICAMPPARAPSSAGRSSVPLWVAVLAVLSLLSTFVPLATFDRKPSALSSAVEAGRQARFVISTYRRLLDWDRDGYSAVLAGGDCDDSDFAANPGRREVPRNGRDDNCVGGDSQVELAPYAPESVPRAEGAAPASVVLITVDTVSAAHVGAYGYSRPTTPHIDRWAKQHGRLFENAFTPGTATQYALGSLMRGVYARRLRWTPIKIVDTQGIARVQAMPVHEWRYTLSEWLSRRGMLTLAFTDDGDSRFLEPQHKIAGRFDEWTNARSLTPETDDAALSRAVIRRLADVPSDRRFFLWVHYYGPHAPSQRHPGLASFGSSVVDEYDAEILAFDHALAPLLDLLVARQNAGEPLAVVLAADHGEDLEATGRTHGLTLSEDSIRVPFVLSAPGITPGRERAVVSTLDAFPTLLGITHTPLPPDLDGRDLRTAPGERGAPRRVVFSEGWRYFEGDVRYDDQVLATDGIYGLVRHLGRSSFGGVAPRTAGRRQKLIYGGSQPALEQAIDIYLDRSAP